MRVFTRTFFSRRIPGSCLISMSILAILFHVPRMAEGASAQPAQFVIVHTNNVNAHLFGCPT